MGVATLAAAILTSGCASFTFRRIANQNKLTAYDVRVFMGRALARTLLFNFATTTNERWPLLAAGESLSRTEVRS
jgi:hypothetical protein